MTQQGGSGLSQPASEEGWQCIFPLCLILVGHPPLGGAPKMSRLPEYKCHHVNARGITEGVGSRSACTASH